MSQVPLLAIVADTKAPLYPSLKALYEKLDKGSAEVILGNSGEDFKAACSAERLAQVDVIVFAVFSGARAEAVTELWPLCPAVRWVHSLAAGVDTLVPALRPLPRIAEVPVTNAKGAYSRSLAEYAVMAMLHFNKQVPRIQSNKRQKVWEKFIMSELHGMTVGFIGFGDIAQTTACLCRAFGMKILALRRRTKDGPSSKCEADETFGIEDASERLEVFRRADYVVCSLPGTPTTKHFCGAAEFGAMKESGVFISIGRGVAVDEAALCEALTSKKIAGAALDVFEKEPLPETSPLWEVPGENLVLTSHNADLTKTYFEDSWAIFLEKLSEFKAAGTVPGTVSVDHGY